MKKAGIVILLSLIFLMNFISAQSIELNYPEKVNLGEDFTMNLKLIDFEGGDAVLYDVKIDILGNGERIAKIENENSGVWKSTYYYVPEIIKNNENKELSLISESYVGEANIEVKIRKSGTSEVKTFSDYKIEFIGNENSHN